jgi:hypothetical protein
MLAAYQRTATKHAGMLRMRLLLGIFVTLSIIQIRDAYSEQVEPTRDQLQIQMDIMRDYIKYLESELHKRPVAITNQELEKAYVTTRLKQYQYIRDVMDINLSTLNAQRFASDIILWLVALVAFSGIAFAGFQLWKSVTAAGVQMSSDLEISASKVRVTSSIVGVTILIVSLIFLYVYTTEIYQIRTVGGLATETPK